MKYWRLEVVLNGKEREMIFFPTEVSREFIWLGCSIRSVLKMFSILSSFTIPSTEERKQLIRCTLFVLSPVKLIQSLRVLRFSPRITETQYYILKLKESLTWSNITLSSRTSLFLQFFRTPMRMIITKKSWFSVLISGSSRRAPFKRDSERCCLFLYVSSDAIWVTNTNTTIQAQDRFSNGM